MEVAENEAGLKRVPTASHQEHLSNLRIESMAESMPYTSAPLTIVVVGASGDLARKKTFP